MLKRVKNSVPDYCDGYLEVYDITDKKVNNYPMTVIKKRDIGDDGKVWFRTASIYDHTRLEFESRNIQIVAKLRIPYWDDISSKCVVTMNGDPKQYRIYNNAKVTSKQGFTESELTLQEMENEYDIADD